MSDTIIRVENLCKSYRLGAIGGGMLRSDVSRWIARLRGRPDPNLKIGQEQQARLVGQNFKALQDVSFDIRQGEIIGIIGRNGAGKSTLLKILSRVTAPSSGSVKIKGRIASLLEVGTGFHPELTGRENVFLNGAILGMTKAEIRRNFDEIVDFSGVEDFIDTPVKRYSSGMYVRLAFAVAAHLEPEILIVDEVLAVGDVAFQEKCLGKMKQVSSTHGRTVLFVSHNIGAIETLCTRGVLFAGGKLVLQGGVRETVDRYLRNEEAKGSVDNLDNCVRSGSGEARVTALRFEDDQGRLQTNFRMGEPLTVVMKVHFKKPVADPTFGINFETDTGVRVADCRSSHYGLKTGLVNGNVECRMRIESLAFYPRTYFIEPWVSDDRCSGADFDWVRHAASIVVTSGPKFLDGAPVTSHHGVTHIPTQWKANISD